MRQINRPKLVIFCLFLSMLVSGVQTKDLVSLVEDPPHFPVTADTETSYDPVTIIRNNIIDEEGNFIITGHTEGEDGFIAKFDASGSILWSKHFGGENLDTIEYVTFDLEGNIILIGLTLSEDFKFDDAHEGVYNGKEDVFLAKLTPEGDVLWSQFLGGSDRDVFPAYADTILINSRNEIIIYGWTSSEDFPTINAFQDFHGGINQGFGASVDLFVLKLSSDGEIQFSTLWGGSQHDDGRIVLDRSDDMIIFGNTLSTDFPTKEVGTDQPIDQSFPKHSGKWEAYVSKIDPDGNLLWTNLYGGEKEDFYDQQILFDSLDNIYFLFKTDSGDFPTTQDAYQDVYGGGRRDAAIMKLSSDGEIIWSTFFGGDGDDNGSGGESFDVEDSIPLIEDPTLYMDDEENLIVITMSDSTDLDTFNGFQKEYSQSGSNSARKVPIIGKFDNNGSLIFATYLGGTTNSAIPISIWIGFHIDSNNNIFISGRTNSDNFPTFKGLSSNSYFNNRSMADANLGSMDMFLTKLAYDGNPIWSTYLGGSGFDTLISSKLDHEDNIIVVGTTQSDDYPVVNNHNSYSGGTDIVISKFDSEGEMVWSRYLGGNGNDLTNAFSIMFEDSGDLILLGATTSADFQWDENLPGNFAEVGFISRIETNSDVEWLKFLISEESVQVDPEFPLTTLIMVLTIIAAFASSGYLLQYYRRTTRLQEILLNDQMADIISPIFNSHPSLIYLFAGQHLIDDKDVVDEVYTTVPGEIFDFKYFLNPVRLSIVKLLDENPVLTSIQIKETLGIGWKEVTGHLDSLRKKNHIIIEQKFIDGTIKSVVTADPNTLAKYKTLKEILFEFFDVSPNLDKYLQITQNIKKRTDQDDLYPNDV